MPIKVLRRELASDQSRLKRFEQEARSASALNHPNIITVYEIGEHEGTPYIAMEYMDGKTLRELLSEGPLPINKLLGLATRIVEGLAKAHSGEGRLLSSHFSWAALSDLIFARYLATFSDLPKAS